MLQWFTPFPSTKSSSVFIPLFPLQMFLISKKTKQLYLQMNLLQVLFSYLQSFLVVWKMRMIYDKQPRVCWFFMNFPSDVDDLLVVKTRNWQAFPSYLFKTVAQIRKRNSDREGHNKLLICNLSNFSALISCYLKRSILM